MFSVLLLTMIVAYEIFRALKLNEYKLVLNTLKELKGKDRGSKEMVAAGELFLDNKRYILYIISEYAYIGVLGILLFTQYWLISLLIIIQSLVLYVINKNKDKSVTYLDSVVTILIIVIGLILI